VAYLPHQPYLKLQSTKSPLGPSFDSTWPETLVHRFEVLFPTITDRIAVKDGDGISMTYGELSRAVDNVACELLRKGVGPGSRVAVFQYPSVHWAGCVVAILKIGAVYVPLDAGTPIARLALIVDDCQPTAILVDEHTLSLTKRLEVPSSTKIVDVSQLSKPLGEKVVNLARPEAPAIILYTSGSTGTPKGVILQHASLKHEFDHCAAIYGLGEQDVILQQSAWSFDVSVTQIFLALGVGARLQIVSHLMRADSRAIADLIQSQGVTATYATPTEYKSWLRHEHQELFRRSLWRLSLVAGEAVTEPLLQLYREVNQPGLRLFNIYGPTETTCGSTKMELLYKIPGFYQDIVPVGRASANESFYILDKQQKLQPCGQIGEVVIGGAGVAMGYLNKDERNRASFLPNPFADVDYTERGWKTMYRTGDLGYLKSDGTLFLKGRMEGDTEIKLNGVRVDLADIEQTILKAGKGTLADAAASLRVTPDETAKFIVVYVIFSSTISTADEDLILQEILNNLALPRTILPSAIISVQEFPRTITGKIDRRAISNLPISQKVSYTVDAPTLSNVEEAMRFLWETLIPEELAAYHEIDANTDFFNVGGNSMLLIELQHKIQEYFDISIPLFKLFQASTLRPMAQLVDDTQPENDKQIEWEAETALQSGLDMHSGPNQNVPPGTRPRIIVLTGATGFLGQHLLHALIEQDEIERIICIGIRNYNEAKRAAFSQLHKVECYEGDLRSPRLGLTEEVAADIFRMADSVIHNGADVSHLKTYSSLRSANLVSTQELAKLCLPRKIPLHFISTSGVTMYTSSETCAEVSVRESAPPTDGLYGYIASKWACEVYLERVHNKYGLDIYIHRPSSIIRPADDLAGENPAADVLQNMLAYSKRIEAVPRAPNLRGIIDLVHPDTVANGVVSAVMGHRHRSPNKMVYIHESGDLELDVTQIRQHLAEETGDDIQEVPMDEWIARGEEAGLSSAMAAVFRALKVAEHLNFPRLIREQNVADSQD
jgi:hybrid polyketide synthase/nonribosomal peptide synthetase ACE1